MNCFIDSFKSVNVVAGDFFIKINENNHMAAGVAIHRRLNVSQELVNGVSPTASNWFHLELSLPHLQFKPIGQLAIRIVFWKD